MSSEKGEGALVEGRAAGSAVRGRADLKRPLVGWRGLAATVAVVMAYVLVTQFPQTSAWAQLAILDLPLASSALFGAAACAVASRRASGSARHGWSFIGAGIASWAAGELIWDYQELATHGRPPYPSVSDLAYLLTYPLIVAGMVMLITVHRGKLRILLDALIVSTSLLFVSWAFIIRPIISAADVTPLQLGLASAIQSE